MPLSFKPFPTLELADLQRLQVNAVPEGVRIDYKRENYGPNDNKEFLKDISSFANSEGGYLLIGVEERDGVPVGIAGVTSGGIDAEIQRYENLCRDGVEPRIVGIQMRGIKVSDTAAVISIAIPKSLSPPHRVSSQNFNRFYVRNSNGKHEASVEELRHMFGYSAGLTNDIEKFVAGRREKILMCNDFISDVGDGRLILHVVNAPTFRDTQFLDPKKLYSDPYKHGPYDVSSVSKRVLLEGILVGETDGERFGNRTLIFRDASIEAVYPRMCNRKDDGRVVVYGRHLMECLVYSVERALKSMSEWGATGPYVIQAAVETTKGAEIAFFRDALFRLPRFDRALVELPTLVVPEYDATISTPLLIRPMLDALWNAVGLTECGYFQGDEWKPR